MIPKAAQAKLPQRKAYLTKLGVDCLHNDELLITAMTHKSYAADFRKKDAVSHNERLEFLGDSILGAHIAMILRNDHPDDAESKLTLMKITLVKEPTLAEMARKIDLGSQIMVGNGEEQTGGRDKDSVLSDCLEALIGYIATVCKHEQVRGFIADHIYGHYSDDLLPQKTAKSMLQEVVQKEYHEVPEYVMQEVEVSDAGNVELFRATVTIKGKEYASADAPSKKKAHEESARLTLEMLKEERVKG